MNIGHFEAWMVEMGDLVYWCKGMGGMVTYSWICNGSDMESRNGVWWETHVWVEVLGEWLKVTNLG